MRQHSVVDMKSIAIDLTVGPMVRALPSEAGERGSNLASVLFF